MRHYVGLDHCRWLRPSAAIGRRMRHVLTGDALRSLPSVDLQHLLTEAYCWDHSAPNSGTSHVGLAAAMDHTVPFAVSNQPALQHLEELRRTAFVRYPQQASMMVSPLQGLWLYWLVLLTGARRVLELGSFMGYSTVWLAEALKANTNSYHANTSTHHDHTAPYLMACEMNPEYVKHLKHTVQNLALEPLVSIRQGAALESLEAIRSTHQPFDLIFLDANKREYVQYYEFILEHGLLSSPQGLMVVDNTLFHDTIHPQYPPVRQVLDQAASLAGADGSAQGSIATNQTRKPSVTARHLYRFNQHVAADPRTEQFIMPLFDGLTLIRHQMRALGPTER
ncbi:hypothetical protein H4R34_002415 [Dimargaris verticillata]|uniref:S-adenosyl-L-methionine-dependent methyltransferase n=1 Tax=Dimargaris verticillata TaxID=2761393 RepID=A0A9W8B2T3_9FUNG|nr:hypothetical protein H4R34_002415 [Dimargaris verticillata]